MGNPMRIRATENKGVVDVKILMRHDMESGQRKDSEGKLIPAMHITLVTAQIKGKEVFSAQFGPSVSKDPFLYFKIKGAAKGDEISVKWVDTQGDTRTDATTIS
ncbi:sulfur-oxidizing protein SoxZ [Gammaproteobacteria bacterium]